MVEALGRTVVYMGEEGVRVYTNVRPVFGVRHDTEAQSARTAPDGRKKSFAELLEEARKSASTGARE